MISGIPLVLVLGTKFEILTFMWSFGHLLGFPIWLRDTAVGRELAKNLILALAQQSPFEQGEGERERGAAEFAV